MSRDWLLIETLGAEPAVVAQGRQVKNFVPLSIFLRRNPALAEIRAAVDAALATGEGVVKVAADGQRVVRAEPVTMLDGRGHGVHLWFGPADTEPPERPLPGAWKGYSNQESAATPQFLINVGKDPSAERLTGRSFAEDIPSRTLNEGEARALSWAVDLGPDRTYAANWGFTDPQGMHRRVSFCVRIAMEPAADGSEHLISRSMNLLEGVFDNPLSADRLAQRIIDGMAQSGVYRAILDPNSWTLIKWLDEPCPLFDWRADVKLHPEDRERFATEMTEELAFGETSAVMRLPANGGGWTPLHVTINRVELDTGVFGGLIALRQPTDDELREAFPDA